MCIGELFEGRQVHDQRHFGIVKTRVNAKLGFLVPVQVKNAANGPAVAVHHATLQRRVDLARRRGDHIGIERLEEIAIDGGDANFLTTQVGFVDFFVGVDVERLVFNDAGQILHVAFFVPHFVDGIKGAVFALLCHGHLGELQKVGLGHHVGVKSPGIQGHVHHAGFHRIAHLEGGDGFGATDEIDLKHALAFGVDFVDPGLQALHINAVLRKGTDQSQCDLLGQHGGRA